MKKIELLAPAKDLESGIAAINYGADAVYIGAPKFGARVAAGNSLIDLEQLVHYAHKFYAKVYVTLNTILYDHELEEAQKLIHDIYNIGVDAIIIQDLGILEMELPPIPLFASTQANNYTWEKIKFLENAGIQRVILARELSLDQIKEIRSRTTVDLEFFIHGALCVSMSGQCYFSHAINKGSANRGACAQPCRAYYSLQDNNGQILIKNKHLLSLKDLNLTHHLNDLLNAGITSFKIEGRLKDINYLKNITSHYRRQIDLVLENRNEYKKQSSGIIYSDFEPDPEKTFNRGYSQYFLNGRKNDIASFNTQKSIGKMIGKVKSIEQNYFIMDSDEQLSNGDGLCFFDDQGILQGFKINRIENLKIYFDKDFGLKPGINIYRNFDQEFNKILSASKTERKISTTITLKELDESLLFIARDEDNNEINYIHKGQFALAKNQEQALKTIKNQLSKSGDSIFKINEIKIELETPFFFPISELNNVRRIVLDKLKAKRLENYSNHSISISKNEMPYPEKSLDYKGNVLNKLAFQFYKRHGVEKIESAFETHIDFNNKEIMITRHCIKYELGACSKYNKDAKKTHEPLFLADNNRKYKLDFDCKNCQMKVIML